MLTRHPRLGIWKIKWSYVTAVKLHHLFGAKHWQWIYTEAGSVASWCPSLNKVSCAKPWLTVFTSVINWTRRHWSTRDVWWLYARSSPGKLPQEISKTWLQSQQTKFAGEWIFPHFCFLGKLASTERLCTMLHATCIKSGKTGIRFCIVFHYNHCKERVNRETKMYEVLVPWLMYWFWKIWRISKLFEFNMDRGCLRRCCSFTV